MTSQNAQRDDFDRLMSQWMEADGRVREPEQLLESVLERTRVARRIPGWLLPERWIPVQLTMPLRGAPRLAPILLLIALVLAAIVGIVVVGSQPRLPDPFGLAANGQVAYLSNGQIYAANPDGSNPIQLTFGDRSASTPAWSRDGTKFAYKLFSPRQGTDPKYADFVVANADGSNPITIDREARDPSPPTWSADGRFIVYSKVVGSGDQIFVAAADGSSLPTRVGDPDSVNWAPMFSPDGTKILYFVDNDRLAVMNADGSGGQVLNDSPFTEIDTALWHPDGNRVIVSAATTGTFDLWILYLDGRPDQHLQVAGRHQVGVSWSPDGNRIAYLGSTTLGESFDLYVADADGNNERMLPGVYSHINPGWSPDGRLIAAVSNVGSVGRVMLVDPDGVADPVQIDSVLPPESAVFESASPPMWQRKAE
jgi:Tol biopolymer transport system component